MGKIVNFFKRTFSGDDATSTSDYQRLADKFKDPLDHALLTINSSNLKPSPARLEHLSRNTGYGSKITYTVTQAALKSRPQVEGLSLFPWAEKRWESLKEQVMYQREQGIGISIAYMDGEGIGDLKSPLSLPVEMGSLNWITPSPREITPTSEETKWLELHDVSPSWNWEGHVVDSSRLSFFQARRDGMNYWGIGALHPVYVPLLALWQLDAGIINRASLWSVMKVLARSGSSISKFSKDVQEKFASEFHRGSEMPVIGKDDEVLFLGDNTGKEMEEMLLNNVSAGTHIPRMILTGNQLGSVSGANVDVNIWGDCLMMLQDQVTSLIKGDLERFYAVDIDDLEWELEFHNTSEKEKEKIEV